MNTQNIKDHFDTILVTDSQGLYGIGERLHDEYFRLQDLCYDEEKGTVEDPFQSIWHGNPRRVLKNRFIYRTEEVDVLRGELRFRQVIRLDSRDCAGIDSYMFNYFRYDVARGVIMINCAPDLEL